MKKIILLLLIFPAIAFSQVNLKGNTLIYIKTQNAITSEKSVGTTIGIVSSPVKDINGNVLIEENTPVTLNVVAVPAKSWGKPGTLIINALSTTAVDGQNITLTGTYSTEGADRKTMACGISAALFVFIILVGGLTGFFIKGGEAEVPSNYIFSNFYVASNTTVQLQTNK